MSGEVAALAPQQAQAERPAGDDSALISMIERAARDPSVDIDKMERLFLMHERIADKAREVAFNTAMAAAQAEIKPVTRKLENSQTSSKYADLASISEAIDPIIHRNGLATISSEFTSALPSHVGVRLEVTHSAGHSKSFDFNIPLDAAGIAGKINKTPTHAYASTITYGRRYAKCSVFDVATKNDTDGNTSEPAGVISAAEAEELTKLITEVGADIDWILNHHGIESLSDMSVKDFRQAKAKLIARKQHLAKGVK